MSMRTYTSTGYCVLLNRDYFEKVLADIKNPNKDTTELENKLSEYNDTDEFRTAMLEDVIDQYTDINNCEEFVCWSIDNKGHIDFSNIMYDDDFGYDIVSVPFMSDSCQPLDAPFKSYENIVTYASKEIPYFPEGWDITEHLYQYELSEVC